MLHWLLLLLLYKDVNKRYTLRKWEAMRGICDRCGAICVLYNMSKFNADELRPKCKKDEKSLPNYAEADAAERAAVKAGDYHFMGIGLSEADRHFLALRLSQR